eukprot:INCI11719.2.p1 GENE.INCI11719.2~~INCI11719.2.p1  ORF type:complete len:422 (+),score=112.25 INCI11719.2:376-1641(+)
MSTQQPTLGDTAESKHSGNLPVAAAGEQSQPGTPRKGDNSRPGTPKKPKSGTPRKNPSRSGTPRKKDGTPRGDDDNTGSGGALPSIKKDGGNSLNDFELTALQGLFDTYDKAGSGYITKAELIDLTDHIKHNMEAARDFAEPLNLERDDAQVTFDEFAGLVANHPDKALRNFIIHAGVVEFLQILQTYQKECEAQNNFMEAQRAAQQIKVLKQQEEARQQMRLMYAQKQEKYNAAQARNEQVQIFNDKWDNYLKEFDRQAQDYIRELSEKHKNALLKFRTEKMAILTSQAPKFSKQLLALRQNQEKLAAIKHYIDAKRVQDEADDLEDRELAAIERQRKKKYNRMEKAFRAEQKKELMALVDKIHMRREEHLCQRERDLVRLKQRNKNMKRVIHGRQVSQKRFAAGAVKFSLDLRAKRPEQ